MLQSIDFPWGRGIGTLGFNFTNRRVDLHVQRYFLADSVVRTLVMFVAQYAPDTKQVQCRSWYKLVRTGLRFAWVLYKREDRFGSWHLGVHRPRTCVTFDWSLEQAAQRAWQIRQDHPQLSPYKVIDWYGQQVEVMSFPCPSFDRTTLMVRTTPGDCTTLTEITLEEYR